ncbi:ABC transporter permease [Calderihabitans maritimus]|uniref:Molybdenum transport system permease n=1 Tax=Calderihabitans maritimus TaxID=1246530 RepID=A0A1Z5HRF6_9FIRM|nr:ABC transporter permease [Calderihabitans maritimus]GAW92028.1 hypothetical protein KKC1_11880 [Calderihabitans maritimus]
MYWLLTLVWFFLILLPILSIFGAFSQADLIAGLRSPLVREALRVSALSTGISMVLILSLGLPTAYFLARSNWRGKVFLDTLLDLPMVLPPAVAGMALLLAFGRRGLAGEVLYKMGLVLPFSLPAVVMAQTFVAAPFFIRSAKSGFQAVDKNLEWAAQTLGKTPWQVFWRVTFPLALPSLVSGLIMSWARALGEFGATLIFAGNMPGRTQTLPLAVYSAMETDFPAAMVMSAFLVVISFLVLVSVKVLAGKGLG